MQEEHVGDHLDHDSLARSGHDTIASASCEETLVAGCQSLPDVGEDDQYTEEDASWSAAEDVRERDDEDVGETEGDDVQTGEERQLLLVKMEFLSQEWEHWCQTEG